MPKAGIFLAALVLSAIAAVSAAGRATRRRRGRRRRLGLRRRHADADRRPPPSGCSRSTPRSSARRSATRGPPGRRSSISLRWGSASLLDIRSGARQGRPLWPAPALLGPGRHERQSRTSYAVARRRPYFYRGERGRHAAALLRGGAAGRAPAAGGSGRPVPSTVLDPEHAVTTGRSGPPPPHPPGVRAHATRTTPAVASRPHHPDLDCKDIHALGIKSVRVVGSDPHRLDGDGDGLFVGRRALPPCGEWRILVACKSLVM